MLTTIRSHFALLLGAAALLGAFTASARADSTMPAGNAALVRGGAPLPQFNTSYPIAVDNGAVVGAPKSDLEISLTTPDNSVLRFLFSPRSLAGETPSVGATSGSNYAGLAWNIYDRNQVFSSVALSSAIDRKTGSDPTRLYGPLVSLHSTFELGYSFDPRQSLSFDLDHANPAPYFGDRNIPGENLRLQYGLHF